MSVRALRRHVGRLAIVGFAGSSVPADLRAVAAEFDLGGVVCVAENIAEPAQLRDLSREAGALAREWPLWIGVDQQPGGGPLREPFTRWPPAVTLGRNGDAALARRFAGAFAAELGAVGINVVLAPVLDVRTNPANRTIGDRALSDRPDEVARLGAILVEEWQRAGLAACCRHFPGAGDSHDLPDDLPVVEHDRRRLDAVELPPFRSAIAAGAAGVMVAHLMLPALDEDRPASLSSRIVQRLLKDELGFAGMVLTADLGAGALLRARTLPEAAVEAVVAGCDMMMLSGAGIDDQVRVFEAIIHAAEDGRLTSSRVDDAMQRQERVKARFLAGRSRVPDLTVIGCEAHHAVALEMAAWQ